MEGIKVEVERALVALRDLIEDSDLTLNQIDRRTGRSSGYHSQIFSGHMKLRLSHVETILAAIDKDPGEFFRRLFPRVPEPEDVQDQARPDLHLNRKVLGVYELGMRESEELRERLKACEERILASPEVKALRERKR